MSSGLTPTQARALTFIRAYIAQVGCSPAYADIGAALGIKNRSNVLRIVDCLQERGHITRDPGKARSIAVVERNEPLTLPPDIRARLDRYCLAEGERPADVVAQLLSDFFEDLDRTAAAPAVEVTDLGRCALGEMGEIAP